MGRETMRTSDELYNFYEELRDIHTTHFPDWRFGQLCSNFFGWLASERGRDLFFPEESEMIKEIREYAKHYGRAKGGH